MICTFYVLPVQGRLFDAETLIASASKCFEWVLQDVKDLPSPGKSGGRMDNKELEAAALPSISDEMV